MEANLIRAEYVIQDYHVKHMTLPDMQRMVVTQLTNKISKIISDELVVSREHNIKLGKTYYRTELHVFTNDQLREYVRKQAENLIVRSLCNL